jgi:hypothetical protein
MAYKFVKNQLFGEFPVAYCAKKSIWPQRATEKNRTSFTLHFTIAQLPHGKIDRTESHGAFSQWSSAYSQRLCGQNKFEKLANPSGILRLSYSVYIKDQKGKSLRLSVVKTPEFFAVFYANSLVDVTVFMLHQ